MRHGSVRVLGVCVLALAGVWRPEPAAAQTPAPGTNITASEAGPFLGDWFVSADRGHESFMLSIALNAGRLRGEMTPHRPITDISRTGESLTLKVSIDQRGNPTPLSIVLTPTSSADTLTVAIDTGNHDAGLSGTAFKIDMAAVAATESPAALKTPTPTNAARFTGTWIISLPEADQFLLAVTTTGDQVQAEMTQPHIAIPVVSMSGDQLVLTLPLPRRGGSTPMTIILAPVASPDALKVTLDMDGAIMPATAARAH